MKKVILFLMLWFANVNALTVLLDWLPNVNHVPIFIAQDQGFFKQHGLSVDIQTPGDPSDTEKLVAAKKIDIAISYAPQLTLDQARGLPIQRIGTLIHGPLNAIVVDAEGPIHTISDLKGRRIGYSTPSIDLSMLKTILATVHLTLNDVELINIHYNLSQALVAHSVDAVIGIMRNIEIPQLEKLGFKPRTFYVELYGIPTYDELIFIAHTGNDKPEFKPFFEAMNESIKYCKSHPKETWDLFVKRFPELDTPTNYQAYLGTLEQFHEKKR